MFETLSRASLITVMLSFNLSSEEEYAVISPVAVIAPVTAKVVPLYVKPVSPSIEVALPVAVNTLLSALLFIVRRLPLTLASPIVQK